ncbi:MAG: DNA polymerase III subunit delta [Solirubrobacterales bacterium]
MAELKHSYLFHGDDEVKIDQARKRLAARAQTDGSIFESISGDALTAENFAMTLTSPSLLPGTRIVLADGIEAWKAADVGPAADAVELLAGGEIDAVAVLICRKKPLKAILDAVEKTGGEIREFKPPSDAELPSWLISQAKPLGVELDPDAAALLVEIVGKPAKKVTKAQNWSPKRRLLSELEKLATAAGVGGTIDTKLVAEGVRGEATSEIFDLTDHAVSGNTNAAVRDAEKLLAAGEPPARIVAMLARSFGQVQTAAALIEAGRAGDITEQAGIQPWLAKKLTAQARERGGASLRDALVELARLDNAVKGGTALDNETELLRSIETITA